jgi:hypothetical protein
MNARGIFVAGALMLTLAPSASPLLLRYIVSAPARIELPTQADTPLSTGDGWSAWQLAEKMKAAERFLSPIIVVSTGSPSV